MLLVLILFLSFFSFFSIHLLFGRAMPRSRNQYSGVATLQGISNKCIDSRKHLSSASIFLWAVPENFCSIFLKCGAILRISLLLWSVLPSFQLLTLKAFLYRGGKRRNQYQKRTFRLNFSANVFNFSSMLPVSSFSFCKPSSSSH